MRKLVVDIWERRNLAARNRIETLSPGIEGGGGVADFDGAGEANEVVEGGDWHGCTAAELVLIPDGDGVNGVAG